VNVSRAAVEAALDPFRGRILQIPPMYSALKHKGKPLYQLARQGMTVEREPREVEVYRLQLAAWEPPYVMLEIGCSPGTYIRSIAHDLGQALGCGAHLAGLIRLASGDFRLEDAVPLDELTPERLPSLLLPPDAALRRYPALHLDEERTRAVRLGRAVKASPVAEDGDIAAAYGPDGTFLAVLEYRPLGEVWHPCKVFLPLN
jgi:tRNA pseudouridine55 synthase